MIEAATTPGTSTVAKAASEARPEPPPIPCPIVGNTYRNTNTSRKGWTRVRATNAPKFFFSTARSRTIRACNAARLAANVVRGGDDARDNSVSALQVELHAAVNHPRPGHAIDVLLQLSSECTTVCVRL